MDHFLSEKSSRAHLSQNPEKVKAKQKDFFICKQEKKLGPISNKRMPTKDPALTNSSGYNFAQEKKLLPSFVYLFVCLCSCFCLFTFSGLLPKPFLFGLRNKYFGRKDFFSSEQQQQQLSDGVAV